MSSTDGGISFKEVGQLFNPPTGYTYYDASVAADTSVTPTRYLMTMECAWPGLEHVSTCLSVSTDPFNPSSWSPPTLLITECDNNPSAGCPSANWVSAGTPVVLSDSTGDYVA